MSVLIVSIFLYLAKILIATGYPFEVGQRIEILDLLEPHLRHDLIHDVPTTRVTISRHGLMARYLRGQLMNFGVSKHFLFVDLRKCRRKS